MTIIEQALVDFPVKVEVKVQWGDMDAAQHVNNLIYLRWGETARIEYFHHLGQKVLGADGGLGFILGYQDCKYLFPVTFPDTVTVGVRALDIEQYHFNLQCHIYSQQHQRLVAINHNRIVTYDYAHRQKVEVPEAMRRQISQLEGWTTDKD